MANRFWTAQNEKLVISAGIGISGYSIISKAFTALPSLPNFATKPIFGEISLLTIAGVLAIYGVFVWYSKY